MHGNVRLCRAMQGLRTGMPGYIRPYMAMQGMVRPCKAMRSLCKAITAMHGYVALFTAMYGGYVGLCKAM